MTLTAVVGTVLSVSLVAAETAAAQSRQTAKSEKCGTVIGETAEDLKNVQAFCDRSIPKDLGIERARAYKSILHLQVPRDLANEMRRDRLSTEQVIKNWMKIWKVLTKSQSVSVYVRWQDVEIAKGETTVLSGDVVTIK